MAFGTRRGSSSNNNEESQHNFEDEGFVDLDQVQNNNGVEDHETETETVPSQNQNLKPLLDEITYVGAAGGKNPGGSKIWQCKHCLMKSSSSYTRIHQHFFGVPVGKVSDIKRCPVLLNDRDKYEKLLKKVKDAEKVGVSKSLKNSMLTKNQKSTSSKKPIEKCFGVMERNAVDLKIIRGLCANGIPFNVLRNPQFCEMVAAIMKAPAGYKPPSSERARTTLLDECEREVEKDLMPFKDTWFTDGVSIVSDGWSNVKHEPLINALAVNSRGAMFMYAEDFTGVEKTGVAIGDFLKKAIEEVGPHNVLQVVTDNAANCKAAGREIEKVFKHIFWSPCCVHTLNLIFKDMANKFYWLFDTYKTGKKIVKFFLNHSQPLAFFKEHSDIMLLKVAKTRFASHYILLRRLIDCREALATTISLNSWRDWMKKCDENTRMIAQEVVESIRSDNFWESVESILSITKPIFLMIKFCDGDGAKMGEVYEKMDNMLGEIKDAMKDNQYSDSFPEIESIVVSRWDKMTIPLHCLGFALCPRFYDTKYLQKLAPGGMPRKAPNLDKEVMSGVLEAFERITEDADERTVLREQFVHFHRKKGLYALPATQMDAWTMDPIDWWSNYGSETPELAEVAKRVLSQPISSSSAERNWSTYSYIHSVKRNRLNAKRADRLVFIHSNIRLQSRLTEGYKTGPYRKWDIDHDNTNIDGPSTRVEDMQWVNLDAVNDQSNGKRPREE